MRMDTHLQELENFMKDYEQANNSHIFTNVAPFIAPNGNYWFTDGSYAGIDEIRDAIQATFDKIQDELYQISNVNWPVISDTAAACTYRFSWEGTVDGVHASGSGRGTNVLEKRDGSWKIVHEHLSR